MKKVVQSYNEKYGHLPDTHEELVQYIKDNYKIDEKKLADQREYIANIPWQEQTFVIGLIPKGSPRPRLNTFKKTIYVKGAKDLMKYLQMTIESEGIICGRTQLELTTYQPTPVSSMSNNEILLAEEKVICPISTPDFDNLAKTYTDAIQGLLILNDNIINPGIVHKYWSLRPRIEIVLKYQCGFDSKFNERKTKQMITYKRIIEAGGIVI